MGATVGPMAADADGSTRIGAGAPDGVVGFLRRRPRRRRNSPDAEYRRATTQVRIVAVAATAAVLATAGAAAASMVTLRLSGRLDADATSVTAGEIHRADDVRTATGIVVLVALVGLVGSLAAWAGRLYRNLASLDVAVPRFHRGWATWGWFVPFVNLVRPKQVVDDLWRTSAADAVEGGSWRVRPVAAVVHVWWGLWIVGIVLDRIVAGLSADGLGSIDEMRAVMALDVASALAIATSALLTIVVTRGVTTRQHRLAERGLVGPVAAARPWFAAAAPRRRRRTGSRRLRDDRRRGRRADRCGRQGRQRPRPGRRERPRRRAGGR